MLGVNEAMALLFESVISVLDVTLKVGIPAQSPVDIVFQERWTDREDE